jgi:dipeptidase E
MERIDDTKQLLLISNSTLHGSGYLDHAEKEIRDFVGGRTNTLFVPYAVHDRRTYAAKAEERLRKMGLSVTSVHNVSNMPRAVGEAEVIFVGGGNTFRLLKGLHDHDLLDPIRQRVAAGVPYIGSSAGSIVACPTLKTTKDMPVVQPPSFEALGLVPFQINCRREFLGGVWGVGDRLRVFQVPLSFRQFFRWIQPMYKLRARTSVCDGTTVLIATST